MVSSSLTQRPHPYYNPRQSPLNHFLAALLCGFQKCMTIRHWWCLVLLHILKWENFFDRRTVFKKRSPEQNQSVKQQSYPVKSVIPWSKYLHFGCSAFDGNQIWDGDLMTTVSKSFSFQGLSEGQIGIPFFVFLKKSGSGNILNRPNRIWKPSGSDSQDSVKRFSLQPVKLHFSDWSSLLALFMLKSVHFCKKSSKGVIDGLKRENWSLSICFWTEIHNLIKWVRFLGPIKLNPKIIEILIR